MMPQQVAHVGVDVCKQRLDVWLLEEERLWRFANGPAGWTELVKQLGSLDRRVVVGVEPTAGLERGVIRALIDAGMEVRWADPVRVKALGRALGAPAKTDALDAQMIARFVAHAPGRPIELNDERQGLKDLLAARAAAGQVCRQLRAQAQSLAQGPAHEALQDLAAAADLTARSLTRQAIAYVRERQALCERWTLLQTAPGVGPLVAAELIAHMPEMGQAGGKALAKLAGLAPFIRQSGAWQGRAVCSGGRARPRQLLYLAVIASLRARQGMRPTYEHLVSRGKPPKVAITACMRRLLVSLGAMLRDQQPWHHQHA